jgi:hypothetical protein
MLPDLRHAASIPQHTATGGISAAELSATQAVELAVILPAPAKHNPNTHTKFFLKCLNKTGG